jgi:hypothetical protein
VTTRRLLQPTLYRRSPRRPCYVNGLANIELQSTMHFLDYRSLLAFARCSRRLHANADTPFAWKHHPAIAIWYSENYPHDLVRFARSLSRHLPVKLQVVVSRPDSANILAASILSFSRILSLQIHSRIDVERLLTSVLQPMVDHSTLLQKLDSLLLDEAGDALCEMFSQAVAAGKPPSLTALQLAEFGPVWTPDVLRSVPLRSLHFKGLLKHKSVHMHNI